MKTSLCKSVIALAVAACSLPSAFAVTINEQLQQWTREIGQEQSVINAKFNLKAARVNQLKAFKTGGVGWAQRYSESWGGWIYMDWSSASNLHNRLIRELRSSSMANRPSQPLAESVMLAHRDSLKDFRWRNGKIHRLLQVRIQFNVRRGREEDKAHAAHQAKVVASMAKNRPVANAMEAKEKYHSQRADRWARLGAEASALIRALGNPQTLDQSKSSKVCKQLIAIAKSGKLPEQAVANNNSKK